MGCQFRPDAGETMVQGKRDNENIERQSLSSPMHHRCFIPLVKLLLQLPGKLILRVDFQGLLIVLHHFQTVTLTILGWILDNSDHIKESIYGGVKNKLHQLAGLTR